MHYTGMMLGGWLSGQFSAVQDEEWVRGDSHMAPSLLQGVWTSCRAAPCQEMGRIKKGNEGREGT